MAGRSDILAGKAYVSLSMDSSAFRKGIAAASQHLKDFGGGMMKIGAGISGLGAGLLAPLAVAVKSFADAGSALNDMRARTGMSAAALGELGYAASQSGSDIGAVEIGVRKMQKAIVAAAGGSKEGRKQFAALGLSVEALSKMKPDQQFDAVAEAISKIQDPTKRAAAAIQFFGRSGTQLLPMLANLKEVRQHARDMNIILDDDQVKAADDLGDAMDDVKLSIQGVVVQVGAALAGAVTEAAEVITGIVSTISKWVKENNALVVTMAKVAAAIVAAGAVVTALGVSFYATGIVVAGFAGAMVLVGKAMALVRVVAVSLRAAFIALRGSILATSIVTTAVQFVMASARAVFIALQATLVGVKSALLGIRTGALLASASMALFSGIGAVLGALTSPLALVAAGVVALGVMAYQAVGGFEGLKSKAGAALTALWDIGKQVFGGMSDAIAAGDLPLAGEIAMAGLKVAFVSGTEAIGGVFGDFLGTIAEQISGGDLSGAWETAVVGMSSLWDTFCQGIVGVFTDSLRGVVEAWETTVAGISNSILELSKQEGIFGDIARKVTGVDMRVEQNRGEQNQAEQLKTKKSELERTKTNLATAEASGGSFTNERGMTNTADELRNLVANLEKDIRDLGGSVADPLADAKKLAKKDIAGSAVGLRAKLDEMDRARAVKAAESGEKLKEKVKGGVPQDGADKAQAELDKLIAKAAEARAVAKEKIKDAVPEEDPEDPTTLAPVARTVGTFSAAALSAMGQGGGDPVVRSIKEQTKALIAEEKASQEKLERALKKYSMVIV